MNHYYDRSQMKEAAKARMRGFLPRAIVVSLIGILLGAMEASGGFNINFSTSDSSSTEGDAALFAYFAEAMLPIILLVLFGTIVFSLAYAIFFANILNVGINGWFLRYCRGEYPEIADIFHAFKNYGANLKATLLRDIYILLWSLLFLVPGIVKSYAYCLVSYLMHDNPRLSASEALRLSEKMMDGWKLEAFVLDWSFFGWHILSGFTCGILGIVYVTPYEYTSRAYFYDTVKTYALYSRIVTPEELGIEDTHDSPEQPPVYTQPIASTAPAEPVDPA